MNNVLIGSAPGVDPAWVYYETVGGHGASALGDGASAMQAHMTNTLNTPVEALELAYGMRIERYAIRDGSGGRGEHRGGDGIVRAWHFTEDVEVTVIADRRKFGPGERCCAWWHRQKPDEPTFWLVDSLPKIHIASPQKSAKGAKNRVNAAEGARPVPRSQRGTARRALEKSDGFRRA